MKSRSVYLILAVLLCLFSSCSEHYSDGSRVGYVTQFSHAGLVWKSWEGHLNSTQTGMNSSTPFDFSLDNDEDNVSLQRTLDSSIEYGWKVQLNYHMVKGLNWFHNRGNTSFFIDSVMVLERGAYPVSNSAAIDVNTVDTNSLRLAL